MNETGIRLLSVLKLLLLLIALLIFYRNDIINLNVSAFGVFLGSGLGFGLSAVSLIASGLILRRRLFSQLMSVSKRNYLYGTILLVGSISLYVYGSYGSSDSGLFHYESFISFILSYVLLRFETKTAQALSPLFLMAAFLPIPFSSAVMGFSIALWAPFFAATDLIVFYSVYMRFSRSSIVISSTMAALSVFIWFVPVLSPFAVSVLFIAVVLGHDRVRRVLGEESKKIVTTCHYHNQASKDGFCYVCGLKIGNHTRLSWNIGGLVIMLLIVLAVVQVHIPLLALQNGNAQISTLTYFGWQNDTIPTTPTGWLRYYEAPNTVSGDIFSNTEILVPAFHPESKNYTITYEVSSTQPVYMSSLKSAPGFNWTSQLYNIGGTQGHIIVGLGPRFNVITFTTSTGLLFVNSSDFVTETTGLTIERQFSEGNLTQEMSGFVSDASSILASAGAQASGGRWTAWAESVLYALFTAANFVLALLTVGVISLVTYALLWVNRKHLKAIQQSSNLAKTDWALLSLMYMQKKSRAVGGEIAKFAGPTAYSSEFLERVAKSFASLEHQGLLKGVLLMDRDELRMTWKVFA
jgi:hypothetical protein